MTDKIRVVHCLNQFFGGIGGEDKADFETQWYDGAKGPGLLLQRLEPDVDVIGTIVFGDNYMAQNLELKASEVIDMVVANLGDDVAGNIDLLIAGPAFNAGRYGMAAAAICKLAGERLGLKVLTALYQENPAVDVYRGSVTMVHAAADVMGMQDALTNMIRVGRKLIAGEDLSPEADGIITRGVRRNYFSAEIGAVRAIEMLLNKLDGAEIASEYPMPVFSRVPPAPPVHDMSKSTLALVTSGGIVPRGNPDRIESANASRFGSYPLTNLEALTAETHQSVHGGYDTTYANQDPNRVLPLDAIRALEREGRIGKVHATYYATVGNATSVKRAEAYGRDIAAQLVNVGAQAVILTST
jgi:glycine reductase